MFCLQLDVELKAGEAKEINIFLGTAMTEEDIKKSVAHCREPGFVKKSLEMLRRHWRGPSCCVSNAKSRTRMFSVW